MYTLHDTQRFRVLKVILYKCQTLVKTKRRFKLCSRPAAFDCAYAHMENYAACALQFACSTGRSMQIAARRQHGILCVRTSNSSYVHKHAARKWNWWKFSCAIGGNTEKVEICSTRCGLRLAACGKVWTNQTNSLILLFVRPAACGKA